MEIIVHQAILHVLDTTLDAPVLSGSCMEMTAEKTAYLQYHIEKLLASDDIRQCRPLPDSAFRYELEQNKDFIDLSCRIAGVKNNQHQELQSGFLCSRTDVHHLNGSIRKE